MLRIVLFGALTAGATAGAGWWAVPLLAAAWVRVLPPHRHQVSSTTLGAALGWALLLAWGAMHGPVPALAGRLSAALELPRWGFLLATLLYPALLAGGAVLLMRPASPR